MLNKFLISMFLILFSNFISTGGFGVTLDDKWGIPLQLDYAFDTGRAGEGMGHMFTVNFRFDETH